MAKKSKRYTEAAALIENGRLYSAEEAIELVKKTSNVKFDASVDVAFNLGLDVRQADQQLRGAVVLPHGTGKTKKVLVVAEGEKAQEAELGKLGRILGPKGLMPNPKTGTVTMDVAKAVQETKAGKVTYRTDKEGNVHLPIGRVSFDDAKLVENFNTIYDLIVRLKPTSAKGTYIKNIAVSSTMGPAIKVQTTK